MKAWAILYILLYKVDAEPPGGSDIIDLICDVQSAPLSRLYAPTSGSPERRVLENKLSYDLMMERDPPAV
jgi:hypothetical protein